MRRIVKVYSLMTNVPSIDGFLSFNPHSNFSGSRDFYHKVAIKNFLELPYDDPNIYEVADREST